MAYRYIPKDAPWLVRGGSSKTRDYSGASAKGWVARWEQAFWEGGKLGSKGEAYIEKKYGPVIGGGGGSGGSGSGGGGGGGGGGGEEDWPDYDDGDVYDFADEDGDYGED